MSIFQTLRAANETRGPLECVLGACNTAALSAVAAGRLALEDLTIVRLRPVRLNDWIARLSPNAFAVTRHPIILGNAICIFPYLATRLWRVFLIQNSSSGGQPRPS